MTGLAAAKTVLQAEIQKALLDAFESTFIYGPGDEGKILSAKFAEKGSKAIANAVYNFVTQAQIVGTVNGIVTGACAAGPVTGTNIDSLSGSELQLV